MFCNQCGANLPDGTAHCTMCGAPLYQQAPQQESYGWDNNHQQTPAPVAPVKKNALPITITMLVSIVLIIASILAPVLMPLFEVPIMSFVADVADEDFEEQIEEMKDEWEDSEEQREMTAEELSGKEKKAYQKIEKKMEQTLNHFSLWNVNELAKLAKEADEDFDVGIEEEDYEAFTQAMGIVVGVSIGGFVLPLLFALLGGLKKSAGLTVAALIFTAISQLILSGFVLLVLSVVVYIVQIVLCKKYKAA